MSPAEGSLLPLSQLGELGAVIAVCAAIVLFARPERKATLRIFVIYLAALVFSVAAVVAARLNQAETAKVLVLLQHVLTGAVALNLVVLLLFAVVLRRLHVEPPRLARDLVLGLGYIAVVLYLCTLYHVDVAGIIATSAVVTAVIGFSMQEVLGNVMSGLALQIDRSIVPGDTIRIGDVQGVVRDINWRRVSIESTDGDLHIVPNSKFVQDQVIVAGKRWQGSVAQRRSVFFDVGYTEAPARVIDIVMNALARGVPDVATDPKPDVVMTDIQGSACRYAVRYWLTKIDDGVAVDSVIRSRVMFALRRGGIMLDPHATDVVLHRGVAATLEPPIAERVHALRGVSLFESLTHQEMQEMAEWLVYTPFTRGETIIVQGGSVDHLYILTRGSVEVRLAVDGATRAVATISAPSFFGEMGMLTGEKRSASIVALEEVECWRLDREAFGRVLEARPEIADGVSEALAERLAEHVAAREGLSEEARRLRIDSEQRSLVKRIYSFFSLEEA
ncbi:MAG TPA: cyclic nucleotide-binding domain-containing protein [Thermoanaerobaculia bacterium]|nr:cyclic nucleotide-binding domain-containing protein [Thermoanaerobaculia bacterium]